MRLSTKGRYGLKAIIDLAIHGAEAPVSIHSISVRQEISERYLEQIIAGLKKAGLVVSARGAGGGYQLARPAGEISVGDVLYALEGDLNPVDCKALSGSEGCKNSDACLTKYVWQQIHESIQNTVDHIYLGDLVERGRGCGKEKSDE